MTLCTWATALLTLGIYAGCGNLGSGGNPVLPAAGELDTDFSATWGRGFTGPVDAVVIQGNGSILATGRFTHFDGVARGGLVRLSASGVLDASFGPFAITPANASIYAVIVQNDGKIVVGGDFTSFAGGSQRRIARLNPNGSLDTSFNASGSGFDGTVTTLAIDSEGRIYAGGAFSTFNASAAPRLARLTAAGDFDASFALGTGFSLDVNAIEVESDGRVLVGGSFTTFLGVARNRLVRLLSNATLDAAFASALATGFNGGVNELLSISEGILVGGSFASLAGTTVGTLALIDSFGDLKTGLSAEGEVFALAPQANGDVLVGGELSRIIGTQVPRLARFTPGTAMLDMTFNLTLGTGFNGAVRDLAVLSNGHILVAGEFTMVNGRALSSLALLR